MTCSTKPTYKPYEFLNQTPSRQWGLGNSLEYVRFDEEEFHPLEGESRVSWDIGFSDKISGRDEPNPHYLIAENKDHVFHRNILRGSKFLANPVQLFNNADYNPVLQDNGCAIARSEQVNQGLMFFWDDFKAPYGNMKNGDILTISVEVRNTTTLVEENMGNLFEAVALKSTPNFSNPYLVTSQEVGNGFTRLVFQTTLLDADWVAPSDWETTWGVVNKDPEALVGRTWNKNNLIGVVQNIPNVRLEYCRPMVSLVGSIQYQEASLDTITKNFYNQSKMNKGYILTNTGLYQKQPNKFQFEFADPTFYGVPVSSDGTKATSITTMKMDKKAYDVNIVSYGKIAWYTNNTEAGFIKADRFATADGLYGGHLALFDVPPTAKFFRIHVTGASPQAIEARVGFNDISYLGTSSRSTELPQYMYNGVAKQLDGNSAKIYADNYNERVRISYEIDLIKEFKKVIPNAFDGLDMGESVTLIKSIAYQMRFNATARGGGENGKITWEMLNERGNIGDIPNSFNKKAFVTKSHLSTYQDWITNDGKLKGWFYTDSPKPSSGETAWIDLDYFNINISIVATEANYALWGFDDTNRKYLETSIGELFSRTENDMDNSAVQVVHGYDMYGMINSIYPEFFGDCYTFEDTVAKMNERLTLLSFNISSNIPDPDVGGKGIVNLVIEANDYLRDYRQTFNKNTEHIVTVNNAKNKYVRPDGYIYVSMDRPFEDRNIELSMTSDISFTLMMDKDYDNNKRIFRVGRRKQPHYLFVRDIQRSVLPPKVNNLVDMNKGNSRYSYGQTESARTISLKCYIKAESEAELAPLLEDLADYLDVGETTLQLYDNPERVYRVILDGSTDISQTLHMGEITLTYVLLDNYAKGKNIMEEFTTTDLSIAPIPLENKGTAPTYPTYSLDFKGTSGYVDLIGDESSGNISIGRRVADSSGETTKQLRKLVLMAEFVPNEGVPWVGLNDSYMPSVLEGKKPRIAGSVQRSNHSLSMNKWEYGGQSGDKFSGNGVLTSLQSNVKNFTAEISMACKGTPKKNSLNAVHVFFYDAQNNIIMRAKVGTTPSDGIVDGYIEQANEKYKWGRSGTVLNQRGTNKWKDFHGKAIVERKDNKWRLTMGFYKKITGDGGNGQGTFGTSMLKDIKSTKWLNVDADLWDKDIAKIGIYLGNWYNHPKVSHLSVRSVRVWEDLTKDPLTPEDKPIMFNDGDSVVIDSEKGQVYLNGALAPQLVDPMTDWFPVKKGDNMLLVNNFQGDLTVEYSERFK